MFGGIQVNEWLMREGYLKLLPDAPKGPVKPNMIDWANTRVWGDGGYYSRIFMNVKGREPEGVVDQADYESLRDELIRKLEALGDENGEPIGTKVYRPEDMYQMVNGVPPDLICYFGNLTWRSIGSVGDGRVHVRENDTGPDDANHAKFGIYIFDGPGMPATAPEGARLFDIAPTVLELLGQPVPADMQGRSLV
jgi:predicted AlkP superfamily phosphohydrolase/phosphomutase